MKRYKNNCETENKICMSLSNGNTCHKNIFFDNDKLIFDQTSQPRYPNSKNNIVILNPNLHISIPKTSDITYHDKMLLYKKVNNLYTTTDPRTLDKIRGTRMLLDRIPYNGEMHGEELNSKILDNYGQNYKSYADINAGHISYYIDKTISDPYHPLIYANHSFINHELFQDPMENITPQYTRIPIDTGSLTNDQFMNDSMMFREDIMEKKSRKMNKESWTARWGNYFSK